MDECVESGATRISFVLDVPSYLDSVLLNLIECS